MSLTDDFLEWLNEASDNDPIGGYHERNTGKPEWKKRREYTFQKEQVSWVGQYTITKSRRGEYEATCTTDGDIYYGTTEEHAETNVQRHILRGHRPDPYKYIPLPKDAEPPF